MHLLSSSILAMLIKQPNRLARDLAKELDVPKKVINHHLHTLLEGMVTQDSDFTWSVKIESIDRIIVNTNNDLRESLMPENNNNIENNNFAFDSLQAIRNRLLDLTGRNRLLNFKHARTGFVRVIDELPDQLAESILKGEEVTFIPVEEPTRDELIKHDYIHIDEEGMDVKAKPNPSAKEWAKIKGFNTNYELPESNISQEAKHNDSNIQSLLFPRELEAQLRNIRTKANTAIEETGANILYLAFGFLEWYEDEKSDVARQAPLYLIPVKIDRASLNKELGTYTYTIQYTDEDIISNLSLREKLKHDFHLELPELLEDTLPDDYFELVARQLIRHKNTWKVKRFSTLAMFDFGKLLMYLDLDPARWPQGDSNIQNHAILQQFFAKEGTDGEGVTGSSFSQEYPIDTLDNVHSLYPLIDDADSSQHSALVDAIKGKNLVIEGPPGSGKSQTITNIIAAAISQGKKVLFVAEKMAALQVVKSRLTRAGLGDFCLELHSHKTQKKQVYENIAQRINKQSGYRYPLSIDIDIQMYEEKKEALSVYADLINSQWKNTGRTIHQIFTTAARYREEFSEIQLEDIKPEHINGQRFDEITARRTTDELKKYSDVFNEVKSQLGMGAELSEHPWFGVYNKTIQLFDSDGVCKLLGQWNDTIEELSFSLKSLNEQLGDDCIAKINDLDSIFNSQKQIPSIKGSEDFTALKLINRENKPKLLAYLEQYKSTTQLFSDLNQDFDEIILIDGSDFDALVESSESLKLVCKSNKLNVTNIYQQLQLLISLKDVSHSISQDLKTLATQDNSLTTLLSTSFHGINEFKLYFEHLNELDLLLVSRRHELFDNDLLDQHILTLEDILPKIQPLHKELNELFNLEHLPSLGELKEINEIISNTGLFSWLSSDWRTAKTKLLETAKGLKPKLNNLSPMLTKLIAFKELSDSLVNESAYQTLLQHEYKGIHTRLAEITTLRSWYKNIRKSYGIGFGKRVAFASSLLSINNDIFKGLKHLSESKSYSEQELFFNLYSQLELVFNHEVFRNKHLDLIQVHGVSNFVEQLQGDIKNVQSVCKNEMTIEDLSEGITKVSEFIKIDNMLHNNSIPTSIFGENTKLNVRENSGEEFTKIQTTLALRIAIDELEVESLRKYLLNNISNENIKLLQSNINALSAKFNDYESAMQLFSERVQLDKAAWFKGAEGKLELYLSKNTKALLQPRWLSTWVDFIRIRTTLSEKGLENLLRCTETGALDLDDIEKIYTYSVFDILSREIILENQTLAYFSGADQNATRKQFREYDESLKTLQREKIAYQVAEHGFKSTSPGSARGKVGSYTEMGLINHQINLKTRHAPIRQLVRKAGESLVALKPCFMMGPHSVAQYLQPGQIEFDIVVMDEASQIKPQDALGTIARGKQLIVVGDPKQLPPTSFFDKAVESDDDDTTAIEQSESILDVSLPMFNARRLRWHYRSRHESLIAFSNQAFYESNLIVFPSPSSKSDEFGIKFVHVKSGRFVNQHNIEEAKVIAQSVRKHILHRPEESLGVVAMSSKQREQIERCIEELTKDDPIFRDALAENSNQDEALFLKNLENVQGDERDVIFISCTYGPQEAGAAQMPQRFGPINSAAGGRRLNVLFTRSKKRMHVFSSMTEGHILATENSSPGVHALKSFLGYAQTGKLHQPIHTGKQPDSDFEISVMNALKIEGFNCVPQVGVAGYFIDLAVQDPGQPGHYLMGVECDGATYHSAKSARDRDRLRQSVLEGLGWNIKRIWSTDWFKNPHAQLKPIIELLHQLKTDVSDHIPNGSEAQDISDLITDEETKFHELESITHTELSLAEKLQQFENLIITKVDDSVPISNRLLRPAMIDALCEFTPISKSEFLEVIPSYLRSATAKGHGQYLEQVLNIIAEAEQEITN